MTFPIADELYRALQNRPFRPFAILMKNGDLYRVRTLGLAMLTPTRKDFAFAREDGTFAFHPSDAIAAIEYLAQEDEP